MLLHPLFLLQFRIFCFLFGRSFLLLLFVLNREVVTLWPNVFDIVRFTIFKHFVLFPGLKLLLCFFSPEFFVILAIFRTMESLECFSLILEVREQMFVDIISFIVFIPQNISLFIQNIFLVPYHAHFSFD